ncbi:MAG: DUF420 domain-containing protein [Bacteroidota bacterium]|nr:DUF420 domain-containing protein [Bacteroidota bacterium]MDX5404712.1 DUF420 domain-containing protein [Bacteroidota bacterium]MDX5447999.1 DUF420 domain-containing protein [Bacteroidota bacterium]
MSATQRLDRIFVPLIIALSVVVPIAVAILFYMPDTLRPDLGEGTRALPMIHAILNGSTAILLVLALIMIRRKNVTMHRASMITAFILSAIFLVSYVISKISTPPVPFGGEGTVRYIYFFILISHILLSVPVLPLAMFALYRGWTNQLDKHRKIVRWAYPIWLYVAVTGVLVYVFMSPYY